MTLGLRFTGITDQPRQLTVRVNDTPVAVEWLNERYGPGQNIPITAQRLIQGRLELTILLPVNARTIPGDFQLCFYLEGRRDRCHVMASGPGDLVKPAKRRLWGVFVGVSRYVDSNLNLMFADNDVLDVVRLFVSDFEKRMHSPAAERGADYQEIHINLALSGTQQGERSRCACDQVSLCQPIWRYPQRHSLRPSRTPSLQRQANSDGVDLGDDLFVFYFSGHGIISPTEKDQGRTLFATSQSRRESVLAEKDPTTLDSLELLDLFEAMPGDKLIIFDACRSLSDAPEASAFDPNLLLNDL